MNGANQISTMIKNRSLDRTSGQHATMEFSSQRRVGDVFWFKFRQTAPMKCYQAKAGELAKHWFIIDADDKVVGRLAAQIAPILMGKHRPTYTPHIDTGDYVIVTNVDKVVFTGNKWQQKFYQRYSGYPGGQRDEAAWKLFERQPERILELAIQRMMPKNKIGRHMMASSSFTPGRTIRIRRSARSRSSPCRDARRRRALCLSRVPIQWKLRP